jgi:hypothetical protein
MQGNPDLMVARGKQEAIFPFFILHKYKRTRQHFGKRELIPKVKSYLAPKDKKNMTKTEN